MKHIKTTFQVDRFRLSSAVYPSVSRVRSATALSFNSCSDLLHSLSARAARRSSSLGGCRGDMSASGKGKAKVVQG